MGDGVLDWLPGDDVARLYVVGFDPGQTTGWAVLRLDLELLTQGLVTLALNGDPSVFAWCAGEFTGPENHQVDMMMDLLREVWQEGEWASGVESDVFGVAVEDFILRMLQKDRALLSPVRITAAFNYAGRELPMPRVLQSAADAKSIVTDDRLRRMNLLRSGASAHATDATRHAVLLARKLSDPRALTAWRAGCAWLREPATK